MRQCVIASMQSSTVRVVYTCLSAFRYDSTMFTKDRMHTRNRDCFRIKTFRCAERGDRASGLAGGINDDAGTGSGKPGLCADGFELKKVIAAIVCRSYLRCTQRTHKTQSFTV